MLLRHVVLVIVLLAALSILASGHYYLARRLVLDPQWSAPLQTVLLSVIVLLGLSLLLVPVCERRVRPPLSRLVAWPASLWMGFVFLSLTLLAFSDGVLLFLGKAALADPGDVGAGVAGARLRALAVLGISLGAGTAGVVAALRRPVLRRVEHRLRRWPRELDGFRIVQISDLHIGPILGRRFAEQLVSRCNALDPDLLAVTGDLVDGGVRQLLDEVAPLAELRARHGVFFVTGNHDHFSGVDQWVGVARSLGMRVLRNERVSVHGGTASFELAGVDDHRGGFIDGTTEDLPRALEGRDGERALILLAHDPATFKRASKMGVDLQLSGHTHGGQIWPFVYLVRLATPFIAGRYNRDDAQLYVSRGTGFWGPPMRLFAPAEITEHVLRS
jgi:predicted MPP superfamily phosphohydrolase